uniref:Uncharacterized protein n=1 Tax=Kalanchoe fedtschenkoi TaxID=63787 RepID=A0A7N0UHE8_KALFE
MSNLYKSSLCFSWKRKNQRKSTKQPYIPKPERADQNRQNIAKLKQAKSNQKAQN